MRPVAGSWMPGQQEGQRDLMERVRLFELRRMTGVLDDRQRGARDTLTHQLSVLGSACAIVPALDDQRRHPDARKLPERVVQGIRAGGFDSSGGRGPECNAAESG